MLPLHVWQAGKGDSSLPDLVRRNKRTVAELILEHGGVLFRGFGISDVDEYQMVIDAIGATPMSYEYGSTPRTQLQGAVFTATEYPAQLEIPLHCESSYQLVWPLWLSLCCLKAAERGGQTPIADMKKVTAAIPPSTLARFADLGVRYIRHYRPHVDVSWETVFRTRSRDEVAEFCLGNGINYEWLDQETLRTEQVCQGVAKHPQTGNTVFFNQAHLFHISSLGKSAANEMIAAFGRDRVPRDAKFGDGQDIGYEDLAAVRSAFASAAVDLEWLSGDVAILDNMQVAHGRRSYSGQRRVLASLLNPFSARQGTLRGN